MLESDGREQKQRKEGNLLLKELIAEESKDERVWKLGRSLTLVEERL